MKVDNSVELKKGAWSPEEDQRLIAYVNKYGPVNWCHIPRAAGLARSGKSCRLRWVNYLKPDLKGGRLTAHEIETIIRLHKSLGNKWAKIAAQLPGRTDNEIKNFWHLNLKKGSKTLQAKNRNKSNMTERGKRKVNDEENVWQRSYGCDELNSPNNSMLSESIDFPIIESYSPSKDNSNIVSPSVSQGQSEVQDSFGVPFGIDDICIPECIIPSTPKDHELDSLDSTPPSDFDESIFWFNILMDAERLSTNYM